jgi:phosphatidylinositol alpha-1,6-mannosyltransferase
MTVVDTTMQHLLLAPELGTIGGMQRRDRLLIRAMDAFFSRQGGKLVVYALNDDETVDQHEELSGLGATRILPFGRDRQRFSLAAVRAFPRVDVVFYGHLGQSPLVLAQRVLACHSRSFLFVHGIEAWQRRSGLHALAVRQMTGTISISQYTLDRYRHAYGIGTAQRGIVLPNCLGIDRQKLVDLAASEAQHRAPASPPRLLTVARLAAIEQYKGIDTVLHSLPLVLEAFPQTIYVIIGDGPDRPRLESLAHELGVAQAVRFHGFVSEGELQNEYRNCTLYVMPSGGEGFGIVFLEAMAHAKPVVAARAGGAPEVVQQGVTGLLVEYDDVQQLADSLIRLLADPQLGREMGRAGWQRLYNDFTFDVYCDKVDRILSELVGK